LQGAKLRRADLRGANLQGAMNITSDQLCKAKTLYEAQLDPELREIVKKEYPELLVKPQ
jgi:hypothetical protein